MSNLLEELRHRHALAVHDRDAINVQIGHLTERLEGAHNVIWELESACRGLEGSKALAGPIVAPEAMEIADEPVMLTEPPLEPQQEPIVEAVEAVNATIEGIATGEGGGQGYWTLQKTATAEDGCDGYWTSQKIETLETAS